MSEEKVYNLKVTAEPEFRQIIELICNDKLDGSLLMDLLSQKSGGGVLNLRVKASDFQQIYELVRGAELEELLASIHEQREMQDAPDQ